jgi:MFS family permease
MANSIKISEYDRQKFQQERKYGIHYKWVALSNTTLGALLASIDSSILIISLPAVFNGLGVNPLSSGNLILLLWLLLGYTIVSSVTVVTIGRLSDMFGRVRLYNFGFAIFSIASILLYASSYLVQGTAGIISLTVLRLIQGLGSGFLFANSAAILTDAFPENERGKALGFNQIAAIGGNLAGLLIGGVLAAIDWHLIFLISVPIGIAGTIWAYVALHELATIRKNQKLDILGNITFAVSLTTILLSLSYGILPYGDSPTGWTNPLVQAGFGVGIVLLALFAFIEKKAEDPMFHLWLFRIRAFAAGNLSMLLAGLARGGLQFMVIIWLQGIWLPLHGVSFIDTPFQAAIDMIPLVAGFLISGPVSGYLSDKYGARLFSTLGMVINLIGFLILASMPADFNYSFFAITIFFLGVGQGMFSAPNTAAVMNSVPPEYRGVSSGMRATLLNVSFMFSLAIFFSLLIIGVSSSLPGALYDGLVSQGVSSAAALQISKLPPSATLFAALLGYNPMKTLLPPEVINSLPAKNANVILGNSFFPNLISSSFMSGMRIVMYSGALMAFFAAIFSALRGGRYVHEIHES